MKQGGDDRPATGRLNAAQGAQLSSLLRGFLAGFFFGISVGALFAASRMSTPEPPLTPGPVRLWQMNAEVRP